MERKEEEKNKERISIKNGCGMENGGGRKERGDIWGLKVLSKESGVCEEECEGGDKIGEIEKE